MDLDKELSDFLGKLKEYREQKYLVTKSKEKLREELLRKAGALKPVVIELTGKEHISRSGIVYNIWDVGLTKNRVSDICDVALDYCIDAVNEAIGNIEAGIKTGIRDGQGNLIKLEKITLRSGTEPPKAFIAHGGKSESLDKLKEFLVALGIEPLVVEEQASVNRSTGSNVDSYARQADCAIILATKGDIDGVTGGFIPRGNVLVEIGKAQELFKDRIIYLLQAGTKFPTNVSEKVWGRFTSSCMDEAFIKVARELTEFGILKAVKPPKEEHHLDHQTI